MNQILNLRSITIKLLEENIEAYFHNLGFTNSFLNNTESISNKRKICKSGFIKMKNLCIKECLIREIKDKTKIIENIFKS